MNREAMTLPPLFIIVNNFRPRRRAARRSERRCF
jgi:hypothetical protein